MDRADRQRVMTDRHVEMYRDGKGEWRWRRVAANGNITADSGEGYINRAQCLEMAYSENPGVTVFDMLADAPEETPPE